MQSFTCILIINIVINIMLRVGNECSWVIYSGARFCGEVSLFLNVINDLSGGHSVHYGRPSKKSWDCQEFENFCSPFPSLASSWSSWSWSLGSARQLQGLQPPLNPGTPLLLLVFSKSSIILNRMIFVMMLNIETTFCAVFHMFSI